MGSQQIKKLLHRKQQSEDTTYGTKKIFSSHTPDKGLIPKLYKELKKPNNVKTN
jgi:hypothetical protein